MITPKIAEESLKMLQVDPRGLDQIDYKMLTSMITSFKGG